MGIRAVAPLSHRLLTAPIIPDGSAGFHEMTEHYSTVNLDEKREAMQAASVKLKELRENANGERLGEHQGDTSKKEKAA